MQILAEVKAISDWVVTSSIALDVVDYLDSKEKKLFGVQINI